MNGKKSTSKAERKLQLKPENKIGWLFLFVGLLAFIAFAYSGKIYNKTIIQFKYILFYSIVLGLIIGTFIKKNTQRVSGNNFNFWSHYFCTSVIYGALLFSIFFWTNMHLTNSDPTILKAPILAKLNTHKSKYVTVNISNFEKDIPVPNSLESEIKASNFIVLTLKNGFWGYAFIIDYELSIN